MKTIRPLIQCRTLLTILLTCLATSSIAVAIDKAPDASGTTVWRISPALATSVPSAMTGLEKKKIHLVDIRNPTDFDQYHIPGALNISLHAIRTKSFLRSKPLVLVNEGFVLAELADGCAKLNADGFKATILAGGLVAWKAKGGRIVGDPFAMLHLNYIRPDCLLREVDNEHLLVVDASSSPTTKIQPLFAGAKHIDLLNEKQGVSQLKKAIRSGLADPFHTLLIYTADGKKNAHIHRLLVKSGVHDFFLLEGGLQGYKEQLRYIRMAGRPVEERTLSSGRCDSCAAR